MIIARFSLKGLTEGINIIIICTTLAIASKRTNHACCKPFRHQNTQGLQFKSVKFILQ